MPLFPGFDFGWDLTPLQDSRKDMKIQDGQMIRSARSVISCYPPKNALAMATAIRKDREQSKAAVLTLSQNYKKGTIE